MYDNNNNNNDHLSAMSDGGLRRGLPGAEARRTPILSYLYNHIKLSCIIIIVILIIIPTITTSIVTVTITIIAVPIIIIITKQQEQRLVTSLPAERADRCPDTCRGDLFIRKSNT